MSKWEVGKKVKYISSYSGAIRISRILSQLDDGRWELNACVIVDENDPNVTLLE